MTSSTSDCRSTVAAACACSESRVAETAAGPIEYARVGQGPAVLVIHGCPGGYDQGLIATKLAPSDEFTFISPSRPGYLRTPLHVGLTPEAQADSYAALLDALGISQAAIIGISGGAPSALQFALRHPGRCWGLVTVCAVARRLSKNEIARCRSFVRRIGCTADLFLQLVRSVSGLMFLEMKYSSLRWFGNWDGSKRARHRRDKIDFIFQVVVPAVIKFLRRRADALGRREASARESGRCGHLSKQFQ
jgi:pimeloyl-ACP methyl ester carboxylesterase